MTASEVRAEIRRLHAIERQLEEEEREQHRQQARKFIGKCYKSKNGTVIKIIDIPRTFLAMAYTDYNQYQFPAIFLNYTDELPKNKYIYDDSDDFSPVYYNTVYLDIKRGVPEVGPIFDCKSYTEITPEEFDAEFDKCIEHFKELISV